jgi:FkbM family methyltransferase
MVKSIAFYVGKIQQDGLLAIARRRMRWYWTMIGLRYQNSHLVGKLIETMGNRIRVEGMKFSLDSPVIETFHKGSFFFGIHESAARALLNQWLPENLPVVEFGGGIGVVSCLANRKLTRPESHVVIEANPNLIPLLQQNRDRNGCRFQILHKALAYETESVAFCVHSHFLSSRVEADSRPDAAGSTVLVPATSLESVIEEFGFDQLSLICDIEGAETTLVEREIDAISQHVACILVEIHPQFTGEKAISLAIQRLQTVGFHVLARNTDNLFLTRC